MAHLKTTFKETVQQPSLSPDLNVLDYCVWSIWANAAAAKKPQNLTELRAAIISAHAEFDLTAIGNAVKNGIPKRLKACIRNEGSHFEHTLK